MTPARCCCATAVRRSTPAASTTATTCRGSSAPVGTSPGPSGTSAGSAIELEDESQLPDAVAEQARLGDGWVKLVGDWIDRASATWRRCGPTTCSRRRSTRPTPTARGSPRTCSARTRCPGLVNAGIDCIEHGTGLTDDTIELMVEHGTALVPTLINIENFPGIADGAAKYPTYAAHMRDLYERCTARVAAAREAGVPIYAGTDAGSMVAHGRIADEIDALKGIGMTPTEALGAACWDARQWLGRPGIEHGASADLVCFADDPRHGAAVVNNPDLVILRGRTFK